MTFRKYLWEGKKKTQNPTTHNPWEVWPIKWHLARVLENNALSNSMFWVWESVSICAVYSLNSAHPCPTQSILYFLLPYSLSQEADAYGLHHLLPLTSPLGHLATGWVWPMEISEWEEREVRVFLPCPYSALAPWFWAEITLLWDCGSNQLPPLGSCSPWSPVTLAPLPPPSGPEVVTNAHRC